MDGIIPLGRLFLLYWWVFFSMALIALGLSIYSFFLDLRRFFVGVFKEHHSFSSLFFFFAFYCVF